MFDISAIDHRFHPKEWVIGVEINGVAKAYPFSVLSDSMRSNQHRELLDQVGGKSIRLVFDATNRSGHVYAADTRLPSTTSYWYAFHSDTLVYGDNQ